MHTHTHTCKRAHICRKRDPNRQAGSRTERRTGRWTDTNNSIYRLIDSNVNFVMENAQYSHLFWKPKSVPKQNCKRECAEESITKQYSSSSTNNKSHSNNNNYKDGRQKFKKKVFFVCVFCCVCSLGATYTNKHIRCISEYMKIFTHGQENIDNIYIFIC